MNLMIGDPLYALHVNVLFLMLFSKYVSLLMITDGNSIMKLSSTRVLVIQVRNICPKYLYNKTGQHV